MPVCSVPCWLARMQPRFAPSYSCRMCRPKGDADLKNKSARLTLSQRETSARLLEADEDMGRLQGQAAELQDQLQALNAQLHGANEGLATLHRREVQQPSH